VLVHERLEGFDDLRMLTGHVVPFGRVAPKVVQ